MEFERDAKVWLAAAQDNVRPQLRHVLVERLDDKNGLLVAADGYMVAVVPCWLEADEPDGLVLADLFEKAIKATPKALTKNGTMAAMLLEADAVRLLDGSTHKRRDESAGKLSGFPDYRRVIPPRAPLADRDARAYAISPQQLLRMHRALGGQLMAITPPGRDPKYDGLRGARLIETLSPASADGSPRPPFGVIMPMTSRLLDEVDAAAITEPSVADQLPEAVDEDGRLCAACIENRATKDDGYCDGCRNDATNHGDGLPPGEELAVALGHPPTKPPDAEVVPCAGCGSPEPSECGCHPKRACADCRELDDGSYCTVEHMEAAEAIEAAAP
jgi:hypothetical protein